MIKQKIQWGNVSIGLPSVWYSLEGSEKDKELVEAFFNRDKDKIVELINQGANKDVEVTIKKDGKEKTGTLIYHLLTEEALKPTPYKAPIAGAPDSEIRKKAERDARTINNKRAEQVGKLNNERADQIIDMLEFWLELGGRIGFNDFEEFKIPKVRKYLERSTEIQSLINFHMDKKGFEDNEENAKLYWQKVAQYRKSALTIEEIEKAIQTDLELRGKLHFTDLFKKKDDGDVAFFENLDAQFSEQEAQLEKPETDEDFFAEVNKKHEEFFKSAQEPDEEFFKRVEEKHRAFFEGDSKDDSDKGGSTGGSAFFGGLSRSAVIEEVQKNGMFLEKVADQYGDDIEIVSMAVQNNVNAYAFASKKLRENKDVAQLFIDNKKADIEEAKIKGASDDYINFLQNQIKTILDLHESALQEKEQEHYHGMSM